MDFRLLKNNYQTHSPVFIEYLRRLVLKNISLRLYDKVDFLDYYLKTGCSELELNINDNFLVSVGGSCHLFCFLEKITDEKLLVISIHNLHFDLRDIKPLAYFLGEIISDMMIDIYDNNITGYREFYIL